MDADLLRIPVGPGSMHVERYGHGGGPVLLVHGFGTCAFLWRGIGPALALANRTAFAVDLFGYGESDRPLDASFGIAAQSDYLDRALTALRLTKATVVGIDLGGAIALHLACNRPERVERLILINPIAFEHVPAQDVQRLKRNIARYALKISRGVLGAAPLMRDLLSESVADPSAMPEGLVARYLAPYVGQDGLNHLLTLARAIDDSGLSEVDLARVNCPTLIVWGEQDQFVDTQIGDRLAGMIPGTRLVRMPRVGRLVPEDAPDELASTILEFIGGVAMARTK